MASKIDCNLELGNSLSGFASTLTLSEKKVLKGKVSETVPLYFDENNFLKFSNKYSEKNFNRLAATLRGLSPNGDSIPKNGIIFRGYPDWINEDLLSTLKTESEARRLEPLDRTDHYLGCGGKHADKLSVEKKIVDFVGNKTGVRIKPTGIASYLYYDNPGLGIKPHVDTDVFSINMMLMLRHDCKSNENTSATLVFPENGEMESYRLRIGEVMLMYGGAVIHSRSIIKENENVCLLTVGFNLDDEELRNGD